MKSKLAHLLILTNGKNLRKFDAGCGKPQKDRVHLQVSIDGLQENHDFLRGKGTFQGLNESLEYLKIKGFPIILAMSVNKYNFQFLSFIFPSFLL